MALHKKPSQRLLSDIPKLTQLIQDLPIFSKVQYKFYQNDWSISALMNIQITMAMEFFYIKTLDSLPTPQVDEKSRMDLAQGMVLESFSKRRAVFEEGDKGDGFYTIIFGRCDVYMREKTMEAVKQAMDSRYDWYLACIIMGGGEREKENERFQPLCYYFIMNQSNPSMHMLW